MILVGLKGKAESFLRAMRNAVAGHTQGTANLAIEPDGVASTNEHLGDPACPSPRDKVPEFALFRSRPWPGWGTSVTWSVASRFKPTLKRLRFHLRQEGLRVDQEMDVAGRLHDELGIGVRPCRILFVDSPSLLLIQAIGIASSMTLYFPLHVVMAESDSDTVVTVVTPAEGAVPPGIREPFTELLERIREALKRTGAHRVEARTLI